LGFWKLNPVYASADRWFNLSENRYSIVFLRR